MPTETEKVGISSRVNNYAPFIISGWRIKRQIIRKTNSLKGDQKEFSVIYKIINGEIVKMKQCPTLSFQ